MKVVVLSGGKGTRMRPLTYGIPKPLLPVKGKPMIDWVIGSVLNGDIEEVIVGVPGTVGEDVNERMLSHIHGMCIDSYLKNSEHNCKIRTIPTPQRETGGDLRYILEETGIKKGQILVVYGDNLTQLNVKELLNYHNRCRKGLGTVATVVLFEAPEKDVERFGIAKIKNVKGFNLIERFVEKPNLQQAPSRWANAGYYILEVGDVFDSLSRERIKVEHSLFPTLASAGKLAGFITKVPYWIDISTIEAYDMANKMAHDGLILAPALPENGK